MLSHGVVPSGGNVEDERPSLEETSQESVRPFVEEMGLQQMNAQELEKVDNICCWEAVAVRKVLLEFVVI